MLNARDIFGVGVKTPSQIVRTMFSTNFDSEEDFISDEDFDCDDNLSIDMNLR